MSERRAISIVVTDGDTFDLEPGTIAIQILMHAEEPQRTGGPAASVIVAGATEVAHIEHSVEIIGLVSAALAEQAEEIARRRVDLLFDAMTQEQPEQDDRTADLLPDVPAWGQMSDLDRALALEYVLDYVESAPDSAHSMIPGLELRYADHDALREMEPEEAHLHAFALARTFDLLELLRDDEVARFRTLLADHRTEIG